MKRNRIIVFLIIVIVILLMLIFGKGSIIEYPSVKVDSVFVRDFKIDSLFSAQVNRIEKLRQDSLNSKAEAFKLKRTIVTLKKEIEAINYRKATVPELDSIVKDIYPDVSFDTLYPMPIDAARLSLESAQREPMKDSLNDILSVRVYTLQAEKDEQWLKFNDLLNESNDRFKLENGNRIHFEQVSEHYRKQAQKQRRLRWVDKFVFGLAGFGLGRL